MMRSICFFMASLIVLIALSSTILVDGSQLSWIDTPFYQDSPQRWTFSNGPQIADWGVVSLTSVIDSAKAGDQQPFYWLVAPDGLYLFNADTSTVKKASLIGSGLPTTISVVQGTSKLALVGPSDVWRCSATSIDPPQLSCDHFKTQFNDKIYDIAYTSNGDLWIASDKLYHVDPASSAVTKIAVVNSPWVQSLAWSEKFQTLAVGAPEKLYRLLTLPGRASPKWYFFRVEGFIDSLITALEFDSEGNLWVGNRFVVNIQKPDLTFHRVNGLQGGLPYGNITSFSLSSNGAMWIGSKKGAIRHLKPIPVTSGGKAFKYYFGPRWLTGTAFDEGNQIISISAGLINGDECSLLVTDTGLSHICFSMYTLASKAELFQSRVLPAHDRFGLTSSVQLQKFGDPASFVKTSSENDGLWTSIYLASQAYRFAATNDPDAKKEADRALSGLLLLNNITGVTGLMARSALHQPNPPCPKDGSLDCDWRVSTSMPGWVWQGDTSSDEVTGHIFGLALHNVFVARTPSEKKVTALLINDIMTYIVKNGFYLLDTDGKRTTWGFWAPEILNDVMYWFDARGVNSNQIIAWLSIAVTTNKASGLDTSLFENAIKTLIYKHDYDVNIINLKITLPTDNNYSDDELTFLPYLNYILSNGTWLGDAFGLGIDRTFQIIKKVKSPLWYSIYSAFLQQQQALGSKSVANLEGTTLSDLHDSIYTLQNWPLSWVNWPVSNTHRIDVQVDPELNRRYRQDAITFLPWDEICMFRWNSDPFEYTPRCSGTTMYDPSAWLLPYWMGKYYSIIKY